MAQQISTEHAHTGDEHARDDHGVGHVVPGRVLALNGLALLVLTWLTVAAASIDFESSGFGDLDIWVALGIAVVKASLVVLFFMHLWWDRPFNAFVFVTSVAFVGLFIALAMTDVLAYAPDLLPGDSTAVQTVAPSAP